MKRLTKILQYALLTAVFITSFADDLLAQNEMATHTRGKLWETLFSFGFIGSPGAWDYLEVTGIGFYPGFSGFYFPNHEEKANDPSKVTNANFHNYRSGPIIIAKDARTLVAPDFSPKLQDYLLYHASLVGDNGVIMNYKPFETTRNYIENADFDPLLPEEMHYTEYPTATGITVKQRSMAWSFPGYDDFIIYDYTFVNTGDLAIPSVNQVMNYQQTLNEVWIAFHSGLSVSTKGTLNFHYNSTTFIESAAPAGGFGGYHNPGTDYYAVENDVTDGEGLFYYSRDYNGGRSPADWTGYAVKNNWQSLLKLRPDWEPELQDPACFGFVYLYRTPAQGSANQDPWEADPDHFSVYNDEGNTFNGKSLDFNEFFGPRTFDNQFIYDFLTHDFRAANDGKIYAWTTGSFGPYTLAPGDSVRIIIAEVAGQMDMLEVVKGDPNHYFPDSSIAAINRNVQAVRNAIDWGFGATVNGIHLAADVPEGPPAPNCNAATTSLGSDTARISVTWDKLAEQTIIQDGDGDTFYDGSADLTGYRIYKGIDGERRGAWVLLADLSVTDAQNYWNESLSLYEFEDTDLQFGEEYYYYVQAYWSNPGPWTSANGTVVNNLPELASSDINMTEITNARPGPVGLNEGWDVFVAPNPYIEGDPAHSFGEPNPRKIEFRNLPRSATIKIFSVSGDLIKTLVHEPDQYGNQAGSISWDQRSDSGLLIAPGLYIYVVETDVENAPQERFTGKLMIIR